MKKLSILLALVCILACTTSSYAASGLQASMTGQARNDMMTAAYITGAPTLKLALGLQSANSTWGAGSTVYSGFTDLGTAHGYTTGGNTLSSCTVVTTAGATSPANTANASCTSANTPYQCCTGSGTGTCNPAADLNCTGGLVWTASDSTGITADTAVLYNSTSGKVIASYTFTSATASGSGATFTITPPTVSTSVRGLAYYQ